MALGEAECSVDAQLQSDSSQSLSRSTKQEIGRRGKSSVNHLKEKSQSQTHLRLKLLTQEEPEGETKPLDSVALREAFLSSPRQQFNWGTLSSPPTFGSLKMKSGTERQSFFTPRARIPQAFFTNEANTEAPVVKEGTEINLEKDTGSQCMLTRF